METQIIFRDKTNTRVFLLLITLVGTSAASAGFLDEQLNPKVPILPTKLEPNSASTPAPSAADYSYRTLSFFMHDIIGGSTPSASMVTGIAYPRLPFAKPTGVILPLSNAKSGFIYSNDIALNPFLPNSGNNLINWGFGELPFGTITVIDNELTRGQELRSGLVGKAQGFYVASSEDGRSVIMAFTAMFDRGGYSDSLCFFGVHRTAVSESQLAVMGGTGKYVDAKGYATVKDFPPASEPETNGIERLLEFTVYVTF
ncbi:hypothetical protein NMG60_11018556 [Bertholletia excelsa]